MHLERNRHFRRGASILPSLFTTGNLFLGFWSIVKTLDGRFDEAAPLIGGAVILDMLDGRIARLTGTQSEFGAQLDSLADAVSFGVAPALLAYCWALQLVPARGLAGGLPVPGLRRDAAGALQRAAPRGGRALLRRAADPGRRRADRGDRVRRSRSRPSPRLAAVAMLALVVVLAFLMVSTFRYRSFKGFDLRRRRSYISVLGHRPPLPAGRDPPGGVAARGHEPVHGLRARGLGRRRPAPARGAAAGAVEDAPARAVRPTAPVVGVGGVVVRDGRVLLIRRGKQPLYGRWVVPGGTVELGETLEQALVREMSEETGLEVEPLEVLTVFDRIERDGEGVVYHYVIVDYLCRWLSGEAAAASDALDVAWAVARRAPGATTCPRRPSRS